MQILKQGLNLSEFFANIRKGSLLMLDYDGTLAPHVIERMQAYPYEGIINSISEIAFNGITRVVIISGRRMSDLESLLGRLSNVEMWGSHGLERKDSKGKYSKAPIAPDILAALKATAQECKQKVPESRLEIKPFSLALHWRGIDDIQSLKDIDEIAAKWNIAVPHEGLEVHSFDGGIELRPKGRHKGQVVEELLEGAPKNTSVAYLGDDLTDEDAFAALGDRGLKVLVRKQMRPTLADLYLEPPQDVLQFFKQWSQEQ